MTGDSRPSGGQPMPWARTLADLLTFSRLIGGIALALMPWDRTVSSLGRLVRHSILLWTTDAVDGRIARRSQTPASWIGERDALVDSALTLGTGIALTKSGYVPGELLAGWLVFCLGLYAIRPVPTVVLVFMFPLQLALPVVAYVQGCPEVRLYVIWVAAVALAGGKRLKWVIESFINGLPDRWAQWVWSWLPSWLRLTDDERKLFESTRPDAAGDLTTNDSSCHRRISTR